MTIDGANSSSSQSVGFFLWPKLNHIQLGRRLRLEKERSARSLLNKRPFCPRIKKMIGGAAALHDEKEFGSDQQPPVRPVDRAQHASSAHLFSTWRREGRRDSGEASGHGGGRGRAPTSNGGNTPVRPSDGSKKKVRVEWAAPIKGYLDCDRRAIVVGCARGEGRNEEGRKRRRV